MYQILCVLMATIAYGTADGHCQTLQAGKTTITFQSATYSDMRQLLAREATTGAVTIKATLNFPEQTKDRYPAVIVVHTLAGYRDANEGYVAAELRKAGFATLTYDSFSARGTTGTAWPRSANSNAIPLLCCVRVRRQSIMLMTVDAVMRFSRLLWRVDMNHHQCE